MFKLNLLAVSYFFDNLSNRWSFWTTRINSKLYDLVKKSQKISNRSVDLTTTMWLLLTCTLQWLHSWCYILPLHLEWLPVHHMHLLPNLTPWWSFRKIQMQCFIGFCILIISLRRMFNIARWGKIVSWLLLVYCVIFFMSYKVWIVD